MRRRLANFWHWLKRFWARTEDFRNGILWVIVVLAVLSTFLYARSTNSAVNTAAASAGAAKTQAQRALNASNHHHAQTVVSEHNAAVAQKALLDDQAYIASLLIEVHDTQIENKNTLTAVANLESQVANVIQGLPSADHILAAEAVGLAEDITALCMATKAPCKPLPPP